MSDYVNFFFYLKFFYSTNLTRRGKKEKRTQVRVGKNQRWIWEKLGRAKYNENTLYKILKEPEKSKETHRPSMRNKFTDLL